MLSLILHLNACIFREDCSDFWLTIGVFHSSFSFSSLFFFFCFFSRQGFSLQSLKINIRLMTISNNYRLSSFWQQSLKDFYKVLGLFVVEFSISQENNRAFSLSWVLSIFLDTSCFWKTYMYRCFQRCRSRCASLQVKLQISL